MEKRSRLAARLALDDPDVVRALGRSLPFSAVVAGVAMLECLRFGFAVALVAAVLAFVAATIVIAGGALLVAHYAARAGASILLPSGRSTPAEEDFSLEKSLLARGQVDEARERLRRRLAEEPENAALCIFAADVHAQEAADPRRAEALFRRALQTRGLTAGQDLYATNRLIDLYLGPLDAPDRAAEALRRLIDRHPGTREARHAEQVIRSLPEANARG